MKAKYIGVISYGKRAFLIYQGDNKDSAMLCVLDDLRNRYCVRDKRASRSRGVDATGAVYRLHTVCGREEPSK